MVSGKFTLSRHIFENDPSRNHLDLFLRLDGKDYLLTYELREEPGFGKSLRATRKKDHRLRYLTYSGYLTDGSRVEVLKQGKFLAAKKLIRNPAFEVKVRVQYDLEKNTNSHSSIRE